MAAASSPLVPTVVHASGEPGNTTISNLRLLDGKAADIYFFFTQKLLQPYHGECIVP
jgi:hypothetical protein